MHRYLSPIIEQRLKDRGREGLRKPVSQDKIKPFDF